jgi:hypothetical protein
MATLSRDQQIQVISCLTEGLSIRATERLTRIHRDTITRLALRVGKGCAELHDRRVVGKKLENHVAAVSLYVAHDNFCRVREALTPNMRQQTTPAMALGLTDHVWSIGDLLAAALAVAPLDPTMTAPERRCLFRVIEGRRR